MLREKLETFNLSSDNPFNFSALDVEP